MNWNGYPGVGYHACIPNGTAWVIQPGRAFAGVPSSPDWSGVVALDDGTGCHTPSLTLLGLASEIEAKRAVERAVERRINHRENQ